jgi:hypothetical protein
MEIDHYSSSASARTLKNSERVILALVFLSRQKKSRHGVMGQQGTLSATVQRKVDNEGQRELLLFL